MNPINLLEEEIRKYTGFKRIHTSLQRYRSD